MGFIADVFDVTLIDNTNGEVFATTTLQDAGIEVSVSENEIRGGKGNQLLGLLKVSRDININLTDMEFRYEWLAAQLGTPVVTGAGVAYAVPKWYKLDATKAITLPKAPAPADSLAIYDNKGKRIAKTDYTVAGNKVTFSAAGMAAGNEVDVRTYKYATVPETQTIDFNAKKFAKGVTAILDTVEIDGDERITHTLQYQFPSAVPEGNFSISTASERNAATQSFNLKIIKPKTSDVVGQLVRFPYVDPDTVPAP